MVIWTHRTGSLAGNLENMGDKTEQDRYDRWVAVAYRHKGTEGHAPESVYPCFNRMIVDAGHAVVKYFSNSWSLMERFIL